ncbi:MAG: HlyD family efflux transporter periplasmic adaptor subunit [Alphaproteobacteria bacterium]|nr:HlyD family efflux transporter periplasmic adaptor subunit [Alphaproteobacteria bacterium]
MVNKRRVFIRTVLTCGLIILAGTLFYHIFSGEDGNKLPEGFAEGNGRLEATEFDIATKLAGRLTEVLVKEGDFVNRNQIVARMDTTTLEARLRQAEAGVSRVKQARKAALSRAEAVRLKLDLAAREFHRTKALLAKGAATQQQYDRNQTTKQMLGAEYAASRAAVAEADDAIAAAVARTDVWKSDINDCMLKSPIAGPVLSRLAEPGEVLPAGGKVLTIIDPTDVYMNIYLPERTAGAVPINADAKVVLDAMPDKPFPAKVTYVSEKAQFTPKEVEAPEERLKLVFRTKVRLKAYDDPRLKPGMPGVAYIRFKPNAKWPDLTK